MIQYSLTSEADFDSFIQPYQVTKIANNTQPLTNEYTWNTTLNSFHFKCDNTKKCVQVMRLGYLKRGDVIHLEAEMMTVAGTYPRLYIDDSTSLTGYGTNNLVFTTSNSFGYFKRRKVKFTVPKNGYYIAGAGLWTSDSGEAHIRNVKVSVETSQSVNKQFELRDIRACLVEVINGVPAMKNYWSNDKVTFEVSGTSLKIIWDQPLLSKDRPIGFVSTYQMTANVIAIVQESTNTEVYVQFYDLAANTILQVANVTKCVFPVQSIGGM